MKTYQILNKDSVLLEFQVANTLSNKYSIIKRGTVEVFNPFYDMSNSELEYWLDKRAIPTNRDNLDKLLLSLNLDEKDRFNLLICNHACSLNDTFWIREKGELNIRGSLLQFKDVSLYNGFKESLGLITFFGGTSSLGGKIITPELTTQGMLRKAWRVVDKEIYLYKAGTYGFSNSGNENYSEIMACKIAEILGIRHISYELKKWKDVSCSRCKLFTSEEYGYYPMSYFLSRKYGTAIKWSYDNVISILKTKENIDFFNDMMVFDYIIENQDRHFGNFGLILNNDTGDIECVAPLFDNGYSLLNFEISRDFDTYDYSKSSIGTFGIPNINQATEIILKNTKRYKYWSKMLMLHIDKLDELKSQIPEDRVEAVKKLIKYRYKYISNI
jgi:hypothetical protein